MVSVCLAVLVSLELCNSIEVPHSAVKPSHAQLYSQAGKATGASLAEPVSVAFGLDLGGVQGQSDSN